MKNFAATFLFNFFFGFYAFSKTITPAYQAMKLDNGIEIFFYEDQTLPQFTIQGALSAGSSTDPLGKSGVTSLMFELLKEGSGRLSGSEYKNQYSKFSSSFESEVERDFVLFKSSGLTKFDQQILDLFLNTILDPHLKQKEKNKVMQSHFQKIKNRALSKIEKLPEQASYFAGLIFDYYNYQSDFYKFPANGTLGQIKAISLADIQAQYENILKTQNLKFAISGNFTEVTKVKLITALKNLKASEQSLPQKQVVEHKGKKTDSVKVLLVDNPNLKQAEVRIGHSGPTRVNSDFVPLFISNSVIGSGDFNSALMKEIRDKKGLVYGIGSYFLGLKNEGVFVVQSSTRHDKVHELISSTLEILKSVKKSGVKATDLSLQKSILEGQFPMKFETDDVFMSQILRYSVYGLGKNYIDQFYNQIKNIKLSSANKVLSKYYKPEEVLIVVYGSKKELPKTFFDMGYPIEIKNYKEVLN